LGTSDNSEVGVFVFASKHNFEDFVDSGLGRRLLLQVTQERGYGFVCAFEEDFYACVASVPHVPV
jgi:hypothetical protein